MLVTIKVLVSLLTLALISLVALSLPDYFAKPVAESHLSISGNQVLSENEITDYLQLKKLGLWQEVDPYLLSVRLNQHPWIKSASVHKTINHGLSIQVNETSPIAYLRVNHELFLLSEDCRVLSLKPAEAWKDLPVIINERLDKVTPGVYLPVDQFSNVFKVLSLLKGSSPLPESAISEIDISDPLNTILITIPYGIRIKLGAGFYERKLANLAGALPLLQKERGNIRYIDLRYDKAVVFKRKV